MKKFIFASLGLVLCPTMSFAGNCTTTPRHDTTNDYLLLGDFSEALACNVFGDRTCDYNQYVIVKGIHKLAGCGVCDGGTKEQLEVYKCIDASGTLDPWKSGYEKDIQDCDSRHSGYQIVGTKGNCTYKSNDVRTSNSAIYSAGDKDKMCKECKDSPVKEEFCDNDPNFKVSKDGIMFKCSVASEADLRTGDWCKKYCLKDNKGNLTSIKGITQCLKDWVFVGSPIDLSGYSNPTPVVTDELYKKCEQKKQPKKTCDELYPYAMYPQRNLCCKAGKSTKWVPKNDWVNGRCICVDETEVWDEKTGKCIKNKSCKELYKGNDEAIACCEKKGANWNTELKRCDCEDDDKNWVYDPETKTGECVSGGDVDPVDGCTYYFKGDIECKNNGNSAHMEVKIPITKAMLKAYGKKNCTDMDSVTLMFLLFDDRFSADLKKFKEQYLHLCDDNNNHVVPPAPTGPSKTEVNNATNSMNAFFNSVNANRSVWKTVDGKFNTARLASDLTSAVVLGTVGGVVSSVVIKKKQVEKGFEVLHCKVGGQKIADWGDEFTVGFRK